MSSHIPQEEILTISELSNLIYRQIDQQYPELIYVSGELFEMNKAQSGHIYITLKDKIHLLIALYGNQKFQYKIKFLI
ncbi:MAG: hypothetical protein CM15mP93_11320 [Thiotrichaceae bacterium]|nr:MAG: hypothetical protein CM15mP93_11320 [Thiotrichaceae bacterium]